VRRFWATMAVHLGKRAKLVLLATVLLTLVLGLGLRNLEFATGQDSYLNPDEQIAIDNEAYQDLFGGQAMITLITGDGQRDLVDLLSDPDSREQIRAAEERIRELPGTEAVVSPVTALEFTQNLVQGGVEGVAGGILVRAREREPDPEAQQIRLEDSLVTLERLEAAGEESFDNPEWVRLLLIDNQGEIRKSLRPFFPSDQHAQMVTRLVGNQSIDEEGETSDAVVEITGGLDLDGFSVVTTGAPVLLKNINDYLQGGMLTLGGIAVVVMAVVLFLVFQVRWRLLPLAVVIFGVVWTFGLFGFTGVPLSLVTISGLPILIGVGVDFAIQMHSRVEEEVVIDQEAHPIAQTTTNVAPPLIIAALAAIVSFIALQLSHVPMIREFGILLSIGMVVLCFTGIFLPTAFLGWREYHKRTAYGDYSSGAIGRAVVWLGSLPQKVVPALLALSLLVFVGGILAEGGFRLQTDPEEWVDQDTQVIADLDVLRDETGSSSELGYFIQGDDVLTDEVGEFVYRMASRELDNYEELLTASSIVTTVGFLTEIPGATPLPPTAEDLEAAYEVAPRDIQRSTVSDDRQALNLIFRVGQITLQERAEVIDEIDERTDPPPGVDATASGLAVVGVGLLRNIEANRAVLTYAALALVALYLAIRLWSIPRTLLTLVPVLFAVGTSSLVVATLGFELSPLTTVSGPLVIAICTEFSVLILTRYLEERRAGRTPAQATQVASSRTGRAFVASALTTVGGFGVLAFSALPLLRDFGAIVALNVGVALLSALVVLPPLLVWADGRGLVMGRQPGPAPSRETTGAGAPTPVPVDGDRTPVGARAASSIGDGAGAEEAAPRVGRGDGERERQPTGRGNGDGDPTASSGTDPGTPRRTEPLRAPDRR
jgi:uncharacterized protein